MAVDIRDHGADRRSPANLQLSTRGGQRLTDTFSEVFAEVTLLEPL